MSNDNSAEKMVMHTPGPWKVDIAPNSNRRTIMTREPAFSGAIMGAEIAKVTKIPQHVANAQLIAAAPELLEALRAIIIADDAGELDKELIDASRAAIRSAMP